MAAGERELFERSEHAFRGALSGDNVSASTTLPHGAVVDVPSGPAAQDGHHRSL